MMKSPLSTLCSVVLALGVLGAQSTSAQEVWSGFSVSFTKADSADPTLPANQDRITPNTWITRAGTSMAGGFYNIQQEAFYSVATSPANTEWAYDLGINNAGVTISAANHANLTFAPWHSNFARATSTVGAPGVLHLIAEDIYIDILVTSWSDGRTGSGGFSYMRGGPPANQSVRIAGTNPMSLTASPAVIGSNITFDVDLTTTGHTMAAMFLYSTQTSAPCPGGQVILIDGMMIAELGILPGPTATFSMSVPDDIALVGMQVSAQAAHIMGVTPFALSNAIDLTAGY